MKDNQRNVLITGGGGFLGEAIARLFLQENKTHVRIVGRKKYPQLTAVGIDCRQCDLTTTDTTALHEAVHGCDVVVHCAAKAGVWGNRESYYAANVDATRNVIEACQSQKVRALVFTSSPSTIFNGQDMRGVSEKEAPYPNEYESYYSETKAISEQLALNADTPGGLRVCSLRPHLIWGANDPHILPRLWARRKRLRIIGNGQNVVDCTCVENAALAHLLAANELVKDNPRNAGKAYFITNGEPVKLWEFINRLMEAKKFPPLDKNISVKTALTIAKTLTLLFKILHFKQEPPLTPFVVKEMSTDHWFDISAAERDFGYRPTVTMEQGLELLHRHLNNHQ